METDTLLPTTSKDQRNLPDVLHMFTTDQACNDRHSFNSSIIPTKKLTTASYKYREESNPVDKSSKIMYYIVYILMSSMIAYLIFYRIFKYETMTTEDDESTLKNGDRVFIRFYDISAQTLSEEYNYLRVDEHDRLVGDHIVRWLHGGSFTLHSGSGGVNTFEPRLSWSLRSIKADGFLEYSEDNTLVIKGGTEFTVHGDVVKTTERAEITMMPIKEDDIRIGSIAHDLDKYPHHFYWYMSGKGYINYIINNEGSVSFMIESTARTAFVIEKYIPLRGVNLGSWFIPERWMNPTLYDGVSPYWSQVCGMRSQLGVLEAEKRMSKHLHEWVTEADFDIFAKNGINSIRIPIGYWNVIDDPFDMMVPTTAETSLKHIDWAFDQANARGLTVLLDFHGLPGAQSSFDHCGCGYYGTRWAEEKNLNVSYTVLHTMLKRYGSRSNLIGIELMNEPGMNVEANQHDELVQYYRQGYSIVRQYSDSLYVVISELWDQYYDKWTDFQEPQYINFIVDWYVVVLKLCTSNNSTFSGVTQIMYLFLPFVGIYMTGKMKMDLRDIYKEHNYGIRGFASTDQSTLSWWVSGVCL